MKANVITPNSPRWYEFLANTVHDFYHLPEYVSFCARQEEGDALAFLAEDSDHSLLLPLILRPINTYGDKYDQQYYDVTCPYGYPGPLLIEENPRYNTEHFLKRAIESLLNELEHLKAVSLFSRFHPLIELPIKPFAEIGCLVQHGETVLIDLTLSPEEIWRQTRSNHRRRITGAKREGHIVYIDEDWKELNTFIDIYTQTMCRVGALDSYYFSKYYFTKLRQILNNRLHLCIVRVGGEVAGAGLFTEVCGIVQYHLGGTVEEHITNQPTKIMFDFVRYWAKARGNHVLHLGGGVEGRRDSLLHFKAGFSKLRKPFYSWRVVADRRAYSALVERWESRYGVKSDGPQGFFPAYRKFISE